MKGFELFKQKLNELSVLEEQEEALHQDILHILRPFLNEYSLRYGKDIYHWKNLHMDFLSYDDKGVYYDEGYKEINWFIKHEDLFNL